ncbi:SURF1 family protein [Mycobacterium sp. MYCO198283]|uniref:SURF1 family cytochrome oxidase biogenesis protein n=1 Tax=Mycobacterium sp. MYCO198283 TaxID=2883505 RepID=UPI001E3C6239|nr:SURF1 family protein [Mycobacterium sp. MYCO198283]MCG5432653.1 SURF1 family protein [Mycobacterium sp. MYCO198283]
MTRWAFLLRPGWLALAAVVALFAYLCFTVLAPWQLGKNTATSRENDQIARSVTAEPVPLAELLPAPNAPVGDAQWRRVVVTGRYLADRQALARLRVVDAEPAFEVLTPFAVDGGPVILVDRGYVRPVAGSQVPDIAPAPTGPVTLTARLRESESRAEGREPLFEGPFPQVYSIDTAQVADVLRTPLAAPYLQLTDGQPGGLGVVPLPHLDAGPFLSYGIQWIAFGIIAPIGLAYFAYAEIRQRRRERTAPAPVTSEQRLADRYGRRR